MWLKSIKENKTSYLYWGYLCIIGIIFYLMNRFTPLYSDDWHYCFIFGTTTPIESFGDILKSQYTHYFEMNGRFIPHFIVQFFDGIMGKEWFNLMNAIVFLIFLHLLTKTIENKIDNKFAILSIITFLIFFIIPGFKNCFLWMSGACNYLWSATFLLYFNQLLNKDINKKYYPILFIYGWICGWTHEGLVIGLLVGYFLYYIIFKNKIYTSNYFLLIGFITGSIFLIFSPASVNRALSHSASTQEPLLIIKDYIVALFNMDNIRMFPLFIILLYATRKTINLKHYFKDNIIWISGIISLFIFVLFTKHASEHSRFGFELFALILITQLILKFRLPNTVYQCINVIMIVGLSLYILPANAENHKEYKRVTDILQNTDNELIMTKSKRYNEMHNRFNIYYIPEEDSEFYNVFNSTAWENSLISNYYKKKKIIFIPYYIAKDLYQFSHNFKDFHTIPTYPVYIKELSTSEQINKVTFLLKETDYTTLPFYIKPFAHKLDRYSLTSLNTEKFSIIKFNGKTYLFVGKNYIINSRVKEIIYE